MNWNKYLKKVRENPEEFLEKEGGWRAFADDLDSSDAEGLDDDDEFDLEEVKE